jgi:hypothetical protein
MRSAALFDLLPDFGPPPPHSEIVEPAHRPSMPEPAPAPDMGSLIAEAVALAEATVEQRLVAAHQAELAAEREARKAEVEVLLRTLGTDAGAAIAARIDAMQATVVDLVSDQVARILGGFLSDDLHKRALAALVRAINGAAADSDAVRVRVSGPVSLYETLKEALGPRAENLDFIEAPGFDLTVTIDDTIFETRLAEWSAALSELLS